MLGLTDGLRQELQMKYRESLKLQHVLQPCRLTLKYIPTGLKLLSSSCHQLHATECWLREVMGREIEMYILENKEFIERRNQMYL